jgi:hypothetical protein
MPSRIRRAALAACCAVLTTCRFPTGVELPAGSIPLAPPAVYARWWAMTESCSGMTGMLGDVAFHEVPGVAEFEHNGSTVAGFWTNDGNRIVLAGDAVLDGSSVRHEMLHALLRVGGHPRGQFLGRCAGVVDCYTQCVEDAGAPPAEDPAAIVLLPTDLAVTVDVSPVAPTSAQDGGFFTVTVAARNPATSPGIARLGATNARAISFRYDVRGTAGGVTGGVEVLDASAVTFSAGETKRQVFDFSIGNDVPNGRLPAGAYTIRGAYGNNFTAPVNVTVGP